MKDKLNKFMQGRYGVDQFARFTLGVALFCIVIGSFLRTGIAGEILDMLGFILIIYTYYRILSRNVSARYGENQKYLGYTQNIRNRFDERKKYDAAEKNASYLYLPGLRTEDPYSKRQGSEGRDRLPEMPSEIYQKTLR